MITIADGIHLINLLTLHFINRGKYFEKKKKSNIQKMNNKKIHKKRQAVLAACPSDPILEIRLRYIQTLVIKNSYK